MIRVTDTIALQAREVKERFVRASGPGGQNLNKDATGVELRFDVRKSSLSPDLKDRLIALAGRHVTTDGVLLVVARASRSQVQNREAAHAVLSRSSLALPGCPASAGRRSRAPRCVNGGCLPRSSTARSSVPGAGETKTSHYGFRTVTTGQEAVATRRLATLPTKNLVSPVRPCVPTTRRSARVDRTARTVCAAGSPSRMRPAARTPAIFARLMSARSRC